MALCGLAATTALFASAPSPKAHRSPPESAAQVPVPATVPHIPLVAVQAQSRTRIRVEETIIRVTPAPKSPDPRKPVVTEKPFGKCIAVAELGRVIVSGSSTLDLVTRSMGRIRAYLGDRCPAQHYYSGFYYQRPEDGKLCVGRDTLHSRSGMQCDIDRLVRLASP